MTRITTLRTRKKTRQDETGQVEDGSGGHCLHETSAASVSKQISDKMVLLERNRANTSYRRVIVYARMMVPTMCFGTDSEQ